MSAQAETLGKETKAQRVERLKREKNPWECLDEVRQFYPPGAAAHRKTERAAAPAGAVQAEEDCKC